MFLSIILTASLWILLGTITKVMISALLFFTQDWGAGESDRAGICAGVLCPIFLPIAIIWSLLVLSLFTIRLIRLSFKMTHARLTRK